MWINGIKYPCNSTVVLNNNTYVLSRIELNYVASLVQNAVLITQSTSNFPLIESLVLLSQLQKFHKVRKWTTSCWIWWIDICMPRYVWSVFKFTSHLLYSTFLGNITTKLGKFPPATTRSDWGCCHVSVCSHPSIFLLVGQWTLIQQPP